LHRIRTRCLTDESPATSPGKAGTLRENDIFRPAFTDIAVAFALLTRLPLPRLPDAAFALQARSGWAFALVGAVVALIAGLAGMGAMRLGLPAIAAAGLILAIQIAATGAMHEDGLADTADGLWGGWTPERRLQIMKDSAIGSYGVLALILSVGLRWVALAGLIGNGIGALVAAAALSRALLPGLMTALPHARSSGLSHGVGIPGRAVSLAALALGLGIATVGVGAAALAALALAALAVTGLALLARSRIGGQTGDILGAAQQLAEIVVLLVLLAG
jgi:adenosylcobinamide-GDP ribazoletransferase